MVEIRGKDHKAQEFSNVHLGIIQQFLMNVATLQLSIEEQNSVGFVLKEVIFPDIPDNLVRKIDDGKYIVLLDSEEVSAISVELTNVFAERRLKAAEERRDTEAIANYKAILEANQDDELEDLEIANLQNQIKELKKQVKGK